MKTIKEKRQILENIPRVTVDDINSSECRIIYDVALARKDKIQEIANSIEAKDWGISYLPAAAAKGVVIYFFF